MHPSKIIFLCGSLAGGGAERRIALLSGKLAERGISVKIVLLDSPEVVFPVHQNVEIVYLGRESEHKKSNSLHPIHYFPVEKPRLGLRDKIKLKFARLTSSTQSALLEQEYYLYLHYAYRIHEYLKCHPDWIAIPFVTYVSLATMMALKNLPNAVAWAEVTSPDTEFPAHHPINSLKRRYYPRAEAGIFQTEEERDCYHYLKCRKVVIPNPIFENYPERFIGVRKKEIVTFCRFSEVKNLPLLLEAFAMMVQKYPEYILSLYGEGSEKEHLIEYAHSLGIAAKVRFHDFDVALHEKIKDCAMFVSSSDREGISNSMLEAMAIGLPCVCTDCPAGGARMMITPHENGLLVPVRDKEALCKAMVELIEHPELSEKISQNSVKIRERLHVDRITDKWLNAIQEISNLSTCSEGKY